MGFAMNSTVNAGAMIGVSFEEVGEVGEVGELYGTGLLLVMELLRWEG